MTTNTRQLTEAQQNILRNFHKMSLRKGGMKMSVLECWDGRSWGPMMPSLIEMKRTCRCDCPCDCGWKIILTPEGIAAIEAMSTSQ